MSFISLSLISCSDDQRTIYGYIEGEYTYIGSGIAGTLMDLNVVRGQQVEKNKLLFKLDPQPDQAAMEEATANADQLQSEVKLAQIQLNRYQDLYKHHATDKSTLDEKQTDFDAKTKQLQSAKDQLKQTTWAFQQKTVYAPVSGLVFDTFYRIGEKVAANQPVLAILAPENIHVLFYIPERLLSTVRLGQTIYFNCDNCQKLTPAVITYISPQAEYTPPIIYSQETRHSLVYLVRANFEKKNNFHPGQPVDIYLHGK